MGGCGRQEKPGVLLRSSKTWSYSPLQGLSQTRLCHRKFILFKFWTANAEGCCHGIVGIVFTSREQSSQRFQFYLEPHCWDRIITKKKRDRAALRGFGGKFMRGRHLEKPVLQHVFSSVWSVPAPAWFWDDCMDPHLWLFSYRGSSLLLTLILRVSVESLEWLSTKLSILILVSMFIITCQEHSKNRKHTISQFFLGHLFIYHYVHDHKLQTYVCFLY